MHFWCGGHSISISACGIWMARVGVQVSKSEFHTHIHLNYAKVQFIYCIKKKKVIIKNGSLYGEQVVHFRYGCLINGSIFFR